MKITEEYENYFRRLLGKEIDTLYYKIEKLNEKGIVDANTLRDIKFEIEELNTGLDFYKEIASLDMERLATDYQDIIREYKIMKEAINEKSIITSIE